MMLSRLTKKKVVSYSLDEAMVENLKTMAAASGCSVSFYLNNLLLKEWNEFSEKNKDSQVQKVRKPIELNSLDAEGYAEHEYYRLVDIRDMSEAVHNTLEQPDTVAIIEEIVDRIVKEKYLSFENL